MRRFAASVQHITGQELEVKAASDSDSMSIVEQELEELRAKVEELSDEVRCRKCIYTTASSSDASPRLGSGQNFGTSLMSKLLS
jgi:hypothetical protein